MLYEGRIDEMNVAGPEYEYAMTRAFRVLFANEPRSYRETIADVVRDLSPPAEVFVTEPENLDHEMRRLGPHLVVCSRLSEAVEARAGAASWIELYTNHGANSRVGVRGETEKVIEGMELAGLLEIVERVGRLAGAA